MGKLWGGRFQSETDQEVEFFTHSLSVDSRLWWADLRCSQVHAAMLGRQGILSQSEAEAIIQGLKQVESEIRAAIEDHKNPFATADEDIHTFLEVRLKAAIGPVAGKLHTARSRNDQVITAFRFYLMDEIPGLQQDLLQLMKCLMKVAENSLDVILPGMTHLQHAQPVSLAHHLMAYFWMFSRDHQRVGEALKRVKQLPLGAAALAGTSFPIDREFVASELGFTSLLENSMDAVADRDILVELLANLSITMMHLSRMSEELIIWSTPEFGFVELAESVTTGSSIMPQKKNPDVAELTRGKTGRVYGHLMNLLTTLKGLPLAYNRDLQEDKAAVFDAFDTVRPALRLMKKMIEGAQFKPERMKSALQGDFSNATDLADDLASKGVPFREAHVIVGQVVQWCLANHVMLEDIKLDQLQKIDARFDERSMMVLPHLKVIEARTSYGGTAPSAVKLQLSRAQSWIDIATQQ